MCKSYYYKGLKIDMNERGSKFNSPYCSIIYKNKNENKEYHTHAGNLSQAKKIVDCFNELRFRGFCKRRYSLTTRNKACRLDGNYILMR